MILLSSKHVKPYIPSPFDEKTPKEAKSVNKAELMQIYEKAKNQGHEEGFKRGFEIGFEEGYNEGLKKSYDEIKKQEKIVKDKISNLDKLITEVSNLRNEQLKAFLPEILNLCIKIAKKIVSAEISINKNIVLNIIKEALKELPLSEQIIIKINPQDFENLKDELSELSSQNPSIKIIPSLEINQGDCYIESQEKIIDSTIEEKFKEIEDVLNSVIYSKD